MLQAGEPVAVSYRCAGSAAAAAAAAGDSAVTVQYSTAVQVHTVTMFSTDSSTLLGLYACQSHLIAKQQQLKVRR